MKKKVCSSGFIVHNFSWFIMFLIFTINYELRTMNCLYAFTYPDSVRGLGDMVEGCGARSLSMGSTGITSSDEPSTIIINPAGLSTIDSKMFSFGFGLVPVTERVNTTSKNAPFYNSQSYFHFNNIALVYPLGSVQFGFGFFPVSDFQYKHKMNVYSGGKLASFDEITSEGTVYTITPACSLKYSVFSLGLSYNSISGKQVIKYKEVIYYSTYTQTTTDKITSDIPGGQMNIGTIVFLGQNMRLGLNYKPSFESKVKTKYDENGVKSSTDTKLTYPSEMGFGLGYFFGSQGENKLLVDFLVKNWAELRVWGKKVAGVRNFTELHIGAEHSISQDVLIRYGFYYQPYYAAKEFEKVFFTAGVGLGISTVLSVDIAGEYGKRDYRFIDDQERFWDSDQRIDETIKRVVVQGKLKW